MSVWPWLLTAATTGVAFILGYYFCSRKYSTETSGHLSYQFRPEDILQAFKVQRHTFLNDLQVISGWLQLKNPKKAAEYIQEVKRRLQGEAVLARSAHPRTAAMLLLKIAGAEGKGVRVVLGTVDNFLNLPGDQEFISALEYFIDAFIGLLATDPRGRLSITFSRLGSVLEIEATCLDLVLPAGKLSEVSHDINARFRKTRFGASVVSGGGSRMRLAVRVEEPNTQEG